MTLAASSLSSRVMPIRQVLLQTTPVAHLARDDAIGVSTAYRYVHEPWDVLAARAPRLSTGVAGRARGRAHAREPRQDIGAELPRCGAGAQDPQGLTRGAAGGPVVVGEAPPSRRRRPGPHRSRRLVDLGLEVRPGREHDVACARTHADPLNGFTRAGHAVLADLGYAGERAHPTCPHKVPRHRDLGITQNGFDRVRAYVRARAGQGNAWLENHRVLPRVTLCPGGSASSPPRSWSSCTWSTTEPRDPPSSAGGHREWLIEPGHTDDHRSSRPAGPG